MTKLQQFKDTLKYLVNIKAPKEITSYGAIESATLELIIEFNEKIQNLIPNT